jgi:hypothetical protein
MKAISVSTAVLLATLLSFALLGPGTLPLTAQQPPPITPVPRPTPQAAQPGDVLWTFASEPPFNDTRVALAVATMMDATLRAGGARFFYTEARGPELRAYVGQSPAPASQVPLLLAAAGFPGGLGDLQEVGRCRVWSAPPPVGVTPALPACEAATLITTALGRALAELGLQTQPCTVTQITSEANVLIWVEGGPPPVIPSRQQSTFLALPGVSVGPQPPLQPPRTGDAGLRRPL